MGAPAIAIRGLGKRYRLGGGAAQYVTLRESLAGLFARDGGARVAARDLWALRDVDLEIQPGEVVGVIGRNGAGKSTLLKILSRVVAPTCGEVELRGRVGSLLEVGTGFHSELTGRENIYLSGAILGMRRAEIKAKFDEIVAFAEIERFLDTPVKRYSSGMYVRLGFAVAAHLEPEILLVDEVLAVGDAEFQAKCLGKMNDVARGGRTILFVSHNMGAVGALCSRAILLDHGRVSTAGACAAVVAKYAALGASSSSVLEAAEVRERRGAGPERILRAGSYGADGKPCSTFLMGDQLRIIFDLESEVVARNTVLSVNVRTITGVPVLHLVSVDAGFALRGWTGSRRVEMTLDHLALYPGEYLVSYWIGDGHGNDADFWPDAAHLRVEQGAMISRSNLSWVHAVFYSPTTWREGSVDAAPRGALSGLPPVRGA